MEQLSADKNALRRQLIAARCAMPSDERAEKSRAICEKIIAFDAFLETDDLLLYSPIRSEVDVMPLFEKAAHSGKKVFFPKCREGNECLMDFFLTDDPGALRIGRYGIMEPKEGSVPTPSCLFTARSLIVVPGLAFDRDGFRIGYGKGYYDRFLPGFGGIRLGICFSDFLCAHLPSDEFDSVCDFVITDRELIRIEK